MVQITYLAQDGRETSVNARDGQSVMEAAVKNDVPGIVGECGGNCACGTCRVHVPESWRERTGEASPAELEMLEFGGFEKAGIRLSCQIRISGDLDGLVVHTPDSQY